MASCSHGTPSPQMISTALLSYRTTIRFDEKLNMAGSGMASHPYQTLTAARGRSPPTVMLRY